MNCVFAFSNATATRNEIGIGLNGAVNFDPDGEEETYLSFNAPSVSHQFELKLSDNLFFLIDSESAFSRNPAARTEYHSFYWLEIYQLIWSEYDIDRFTFETSPGFKVEEGDFSAGFNFTYRYDYEKWHEALTETTPLYPTGTGNYFDVKIDKEIFDYSFLVCYRKEDFSLKAYVLNRLKSTHTDYLELSDKKDTKQSLSNTHERTDFPFIYGIGAAYSLPIDDNSKLKAEAIFEMFERENDKNNYIRVSIDHACEITPALKLSSGLKYEAFYYEYSYDPIFPENSDPEVPYLGGSFKGDFAYISLDAALKYYPLNNLETSFSVSYGTYSGAAHLTDKIKLGAGVLYSFNFAGSDPSRK